MRGYKKKPNDPICAVTKMIGICGRCRTKFERNIRFYVPYLDNNCNKCINDHGSKKCLMN